MKTLTAKELRIGNWFTSVKFGTRVRCELVDLYELCHLSDGAYNDPPIDEMFTPIPLTPKWILNVGFDGMFSGAGYHKNGVEIGYNHNGFYILSTGHQLEYIHQLQNLYFALCGEELTIKESDTITNIKEE